MPRQIVLDGVQAGGINVFKDSGGAVRVQANYRLLAGSEVVRSDSKDVTALLTPAQVQALSAAFDGVFAAVRSVELAT